MQTVFLPFIDCANPLSLQVHSDITWLVSPLGKTISNFFLKPLNAESQVNRFPQFIAYFHLWSMQYPSLDQSLIHSLYPQTLLSFFPHKSQPMECLMWSSWNEFWQNTCFTLSGYTFNLPKWHKVRHILLFSVLKPHQGWSVVHAVSGPGPGAP